MATVDKNFKVKHGLIVEGTTATVNGEDIITTGSTTDSLPQGSTNKYYSTTQAKSDAADLLTGANLTNITITGDENGLTITAENGGIQNLSSFDTDDLTEGTTNLYFTDSRAVDAVETAATSDNTANKIVQRDGSGNFAAGNVSATQVTVQDAGQIYEDSALNIDSNSGYDINISANQDVNITSANGDIILNADGAEYIGSATSDNRIATRGHVDYKIGDVTVDGSTGNTVADRIASAASTAETNANGYTDTKLGDYTKTTDLDETVDGYGYLKSADLSGYATESYVTTAVDNLVDGAPGLLDTLNEIAAAIADDANYATTMTTALSGKQNELTAGTNISIVSDTISVTGLSSTDISDFSTAALSATASAYDVAGAASSAQTAAENYADGLATNYDATGTASGLVDDLKDGTTAFTAVNLNSVAQTVAATTTVATAGAAVIHSFSYESYGYRTAEYLVKVATSTHTEVSKILLTVEPGTLNIAITEYGIVGTNGSLANLTAEINGTAKTVELKATTLNNGTTVTVVGTLIK